MKEILIHDEAEAELHEAAQYYESRRRGLGLEFQAEARVAVAAVQESPDSFASSLQGTKKFLTKRFPFIVHYLELLEHIWVIAFAHAKRRPGYWKTRVGHPPPD